MKVFVSAGWPPPDRSTGQFCEKLKWVETTLAGNSSYWSQKFNTSPGFDTGQYDKLLVSQYSRLQKMSYEIINDYCKKEICQREHKKRRGTTEIIVI